jgi:biotin operon repressor
MSQDLLTEISNAFEPFDPPPQGAYVDCGAVRGDWSILTELGRKIVRSKTTTCQLYTGHTGAGKSTELLRLEKHLTEQKYFVVNFGADDEDIDIADTEYADILMACTKHLVKKVKFEDQNPLKGISNWLKARAESLSDLLLTELSFDGLTLEQQVSEITKITATIKAQPDNRKKIRDKINANAPSLLQVLNDFIDAGKKSLVKQGYKDLVLIVDNLDRIIESQKSANELSNYDEIFIKRHDQMRGLHCHVIYTVPISMVYSERCTQLQNNFNETDVLPMIMLQNEKGEKIEEGLNKFREIIAKRIAPITVNGQDIGLTLSKAVETQVFESQEVFERLCLMSGGHIRLFIKMIQKALDHTDELPISRKAVNRAIEDAKEDYLNAIFDHQWNLLSEVNATNQIPNAENDKEYPRLLANRCVLEYRYRDQDDKLKRWYAVHPLVKELDKFRV